MDPNATLRRIIEAARAGNRDEYIEACRELADWLWKGGFSPTVPEGMKYIPGTGTAWAVLSPAPGSGGWQLVRYDGRGYVVERYALTGPYSAIPLAKRGTSNPVRWYVERRPDDPDPLGPYEDSGAAEQAARDLQAAAPSVEV